MWSLGVTMFCMIFNQLPYWDNDNCANEFSILDIILKNDVYIPEDVRVIIDKDPEDNDSSISSKLIDLLLRLLDKNPSTRMTVDELCAWFE